MSEQLGQDEVNITDKFIEDFSRYVIGSLIPALVGVVSVIILTRAFAPRLYGQYSLAMVFVTIISTVSAGWIGQSILRLESELDNNLLISSSIISLISSNAILVTVGMFFYVLVPFESSSYRWLFISGGVLIISRSVFMVTKSILQARLDSRSVTILRVSRSIGRLLFGLPLAIIIIKHPAGWMLGAAIAAIVSASSIGIFTIKCWRISIHPDTIRRMVSFGFPMIGWLLGFTMLTFIDRLLLEYFLNSRIVGLYTANYDIANKALPLALAPIIQASHPIIMNKWSGDNVSEVQSTITEMTRYFLIVGLPATVLVAMSSEQLSGILLDDRYHGGHNIIAIIAISILLWQMAMLVHKGLEVKEKTNTMLIGVLLATVSNILLNIVLIPKQGYQGAAIATLLSFLIYLIFAFLIAEKYVPWRPPVRTLKNVLISSTIMAGSIYIIQNIFYGIFRES